MKFAIPTFKKFFGLKDRKPNITVSYEKNGDNYTYKATNNGTVVCQAEITDTPSRVNINTIYTPIEHRRSGFASELLKQIEKDFAGRVIQVKPIPFVKKTGDPKIALQDLYHFYTSKGYKKVNDNNVLIKKALVQEDITIAGGALGAAAAVGQTSNTDWYAPGNAQMPSYIGAKRKKKKIFRRSLIK